MSELISIILAAGEGTRMRSLVPKVLHEVGGLPMVGHVVHSALAAGAGRIVTVTGPGHEKVREAVARIAPDTGFAEQTERLGTGHAVAQAREYWRDAEGFVIVLFADNPLIGPETIRAVAARLEAGADLVVVGFEPEDPTGYGRLLVRDGKLVAIREHKDASEAERAVGLCNSGIMGFRAEALRAVIDRIGNDNTKGEFYLTDAVELANADGLAVAVETAETEAVLGVNDRGQLAEAEAVFQRRRRAEAMAGGATLRDPESTYFAFDTVIGPDVVVEPHVVFGRGVTIESGAIIRAFSHLEGAHVGPGAEVGPFARLRPGARLGEGSKAGNFVEIKQAEIGRGAKINHLSYIGDAEIGAKTNVGAGTITANYDGVNKDRTVVGEGAFIGSNTVLVAPVTVGDGAYVGTGSVITRDIEPDALGIARARQENKPGYAGRLRARALARKNNPGS